MAINFSSANITPNYNNHSEKAVTLRLLITLIFSFQVMLFAGSDAIAQPITNWSTPPVSISLLGQNPAAPKISLSADGTKAIAIWSAFDGMGLKIQSRVATISGNTATWGVIVDIHGLGGSPQIALSADGTIATAMWIDGTDPVIKSRSATITGNTATWGSIVDIYSANPIISLLEDTQIAISADGTMATAIWADTPGSNKIVMSNSAAIAGNTATWGTAIDLSATGNDAKNPDLALSSDGTKAIVIWARFNGSNSIAQSINATIAGNLAAWGTVADVSSLGQDTYDSEVALSADGTIATAIWGLPVLGVPQVKNRTAIITGNTAAWGPVADVSTTPLQSAAGATNISLSADGTKAAAIWYGHNGSNFVVQGCNATISGDTATWEAVTDLSDSGRDNYNTTIALSPDGNIIMATWVRVGASEEVIQARSASVMGNTATWSSSIDISNAGEHSYSTDLSLSNDGTMGSAVWSASGTGFFAIHSSSFVLALPTPTPTTTPTATATNTPTATPTNTPTATNTATATSTQIPSSPTPDNTPEIIVIDSGSKNNNLGTPQVSDISQNASGSYVIKTCINFQNVKGTANIYGIAKKSGSKRNLLLKRVRRANPCFSFKTSQPGIYEAFFRQDRFQLPALFSKRLRIKITS